VKGGVWGLGLRGAFCLHGPSGGPLRPERACCSSLLDCLSCPGIREGSYFSLSGQMLSMRIRFLLLISMHLLLAGCGRVKLKDPAPAPETLPPATHSGANTFACRVNGQVWLYGTRYAINPSQIEPLAVQIGGGRLFILANRQKEGEQPSAIKISFCGFRGLGEYDLFFPSQSRCGEVYYVNDVTHKYYDADSTSNSILTVTHYDTVSRIIAGRFQFTGIAAPGDTVRVTDGRFDLKF